MANYIGFIDNSGKIDQVTGNFFAYGLLKLNRTWPLYKRLKDLNKEAYEFASKNKICFTEFKFNKVNKTTLPFYKHLINIFFSEQENYFAGIVADKSQARACRLDDWASYISFSKELVKEHVKEHDCVCILADRLDKPMSSTYFYEPEVGKIPKVFNVCMLESNASLFIQLVDVLIGTVRVAFERDRYGYKDIYKLQLVDHLRVHIGDKNSFLRTHGLACDFSIGRPYFFVREWRWK